MNLKILCSWALLCTTPVLFSNNCNAVKWNTGCSTHPVREDAPEASSHNVSPRLRSFSKQFIDCFSDIGAIDVEELSKLPDSDQLRPSLKNNERVKNLIHGKVEQLRVLYPRLFQSYELNGAEGYKIAYSAIVKFINKFKDEIIITALDLLEYFEVPSQMMDSLNIKNPLSFEAPILYLDSMCKDWHSKSIVIFYKLSSIQKLKNINDSMWKILLDEKKSGTKITSLLKRPVSPRHPLLHFERNHIDGLNEQILKQRVKNFLNEFSIMDMTNVAEFDKTKLPELNPSLMGNEGFKKLISAKGAQFCTKCSESLPKSARNEYKKVVKKTFSAIQKFIGKYNVDTIIEACNFLDNIIKSIPYEIINNFDIENAQSCETLLSCLQSKCDPHFANIAMFYCLSYIDINDQGIPFAFAPGNRYGNPKIMSLLKSDDIPLSSIIHTQITEKNNKILSLELSLQNKDKEFNDKLQDQLKKQFEKQRTSFQKLYNSQKKKMDDLMKEIDMLRSKNSEIEKSEEDYSDFRIQLNETEKLLDTSKQDLKESQERIIELETQLEDNKKTLEKKNEDAKFAFEFFKKSANIGVTAPNLLYPEKFTESDSPIPFSEVGSFLRSFKNLDKRVIDKAISICGSVNGFTYDSNTKCGIYPVYHKTDSAQCAPTGVSVFAVPYPVPLTFTPDPDHVPENLAFIALGEHPKNSNNSITYEITVQAVPGTLGNTIELKKLINSKK